MVGAKELRGTVSASTGLRPVTASGMPASSKAAGSQMSSRAAGWLRQAARRSRHGSGCSCPAGSGTRPDPSWAGSGPWAGRTPPPAPVPATMKKQLVVFIGSSGGKATRSWRCCLLSGAWNLPMPTISQWGNGNQFSCRPAPLVARVAHRDAGLVALGERGDPEAGAREEGDAQVADEALGGDAATGEGRSAPGSARSGSGSWLPRSRSCRTRRRCSGSGRRSCPPGLARPARWRRPPAPRPCRRRRARCCPR